MVTPIPLSENSSEDSEVTQFFYVLLKWLGISLLCLFVGGPLVFYTAIYAPFALMGLFTGVAYALWKST